MAFLSREALEKIGFESLGRNVQVSDRAVFYNPAKISIGDNTRIDDFCIFSAGAGGIEIGTHVHIACYVSLIGAAKITVEDFAGISARTAVYSSNDDYSGTALTNPTIPDEYKNVNSAPVFLGKHVIVGAGSVILPGSILEIGVAVGSLSLVSGTLSEFSVYVGCPVRKIRERSRDLITLEEKFRADERF